METVNDASDLCRMCVKDLSMSSEYYLIEGELSELTESLTGISVDPNDTNLPLSMCTNCFNILSNFNSTKMTWIENQSQFGELELEFQEVVKKESQEQEEIELEEATFEVTDDAQLEFDYPVEYIDEMELNEAAISSDSSTKDEVADEKASVRTKSKRASGEGSLRGKDIYQKLLKKCDVCEKQVEKNRMDGHMNKHRNIRPYTCEVDACGKSFYCKLLLRLHKTSIHTGQSVKCDVCGKSFPSERSLYSHTLRHRNANKYNCTYCERRFNNSNSLKRHLAIHSGIREFSCEHCNSSFYRKFNLDVHIRTVHQKTKLFTCDFCPKRFGYARLLRHHINKVHADIDVEYQEAEFTVEC